MSQIDIRFTIQITNFKRSTLRVDRFQFKSLMPSLRKNEVMPSARLRGEIWVKRCMYVAGSKSISGLWRRLDKIVPDRTSWSQYKAGSIQPKNSTIAAIERELPGTAIVWNHGPFNLPFWTVLDASPSSCDAYIRHYLKKSIIPGGSILYAESLDKSSHLDLVHGLIQLVLPTHVWRRSKEIDLLPYIDELYECRRKLLAEASIDQPTLPKSIKRSNPVLSELAASYYDQGLTPPWEEDAETVEGVDYQESYDRGIYQLIPITGISISDFLFAFTPNPDYDEELEIGYDIAPVKSLKFVPKAIQAMAHELAYSRLSSSKRYVTFSLDDLLVIKPNPLSTCYNEYISKKDGVHNPVLRRFNGIKASTPNLFRYDTLLAFIAVIFLCRSSRKSLEKAVADFLWDGVQMAIKSQFNQDVYDIVKPR